MLEHACMPTGLEVGAALWDLPAEKGQVPGGFRERHVNVIPNVVVFGVSPLRGD